MKPKARVTEKNESDFVPMWKEGIKRTWKKNSRKKGCSNGLLQYRYDL